MTAFITEAELASYLQLPAGSVPAGAMAVTLANGLATEVLGETYAPSPVPVTLKAILLEVAARGWRNPQGFSSVTVGIDDYDKTVRREGAALTTGGVYLTDGEKATLLEFIGVARRKVGSFPLKVPYAY